MKLDPITVAALARARAVLAERMRCEAAVVAHSGDTLPVLRQAREGAAQALAEAEAALYASLAVVDTVAADKAEALCAPLAATLTAADDALERAERVDVVLRKNLTRAEADQAAEIVALRATVQQYGHALLLGWNECLQQAGVEYVKVLRQIAAEASATGNVAVLRGLGDVVLPDLSAPASPMVAHARVRLADSSTVALGADAIDATLAAELSGPRRLLAEVTGYVPFSVREASAARPVGSWAGTNGGVPITPTVAAEDAAPARTTTTTAAAAMPAARRGRSAGSAVRLA